MAVSAPAVPARSTNGGAQQVSSHRQQAVILETGLPVLLQACGYPIQTALCSQAGISRSGGIPDELPPRWMRARVLVSAMLATRSAFEHELNDVWLERLIEADFDWRQVSG